MLKVSKILKKIKIPDGLVTWREKPLVISQSLFRILMLVLLYGCNSGPSEYALSPQAFADKLKSASEATLVDVRTAEEFAGSHLAGAKNYDWNGGHFDHQVMNLDKEKPVFVYCSRGGRSASAAERMRSMGFKQVFELDGGLDKWEIDGLPVAR